VGEETVHVDIAAAVLASFAANTAGDGSGRGVLVGVESTGLTLLSPGKELELAELGHGTGSGAGGKGRDGSEESGLHFG